MEELNRDDEAIDVLTVQQKLNNMHMLENVGTTSTFSNWRMIRRLQSECEYYARIVEEKSLLRKLDSNKIARESFEQRRTVYLSF